MNQSLKVGDIVKLKDGRAVYILKTLNKSEKTATILSRYNIVYEVSNISRLKKLNVKFKSFDELPKDPGECCKMIFGKKYILVLKLLNERFKIVPDIPWLSISNYGRALSTRDLMEEVLLDIFFNKDKQLFIDTKSYDYYNTYNQRYPSVAILVALLFVDNPMKYKSIIHKDSNPTHNNCSNLEWAKNGEKIVEPEIPEKYFFKVRKVKKELPENDTYQDAYYDDYGDHTDEEIIMKALEDGYGENFGY